MGFLLLWSVKKVATELNIGSEIARQSIFGGLFPLNNSQKNRQNQLNGVSRVALIHFTPLNDFSGGKS